MKTAILCANLLTLALSTGLGLATSRAAVPIDVFGTVIDQPGKYVLTADLDSGGAPGPAIKIIADEVVLDLNGHTITGNSATTDPANLGILVEGTAEAPRIDVQVRNGTVTRFHYGVWLHETRDSHVAGMTATGCRGGIGLNRSSGNQVRGNVADGNSSLGILLQRDCDGNVLAQNSCSGNVAQGIVLQNAGEGGCDDNQILRNTCSWNGIVGIWLLTASNGNRIVNNVVMNNTALGAGFPHGGIVLGYLAAAPWPAGNHIVGNTILGNTLPAPNFSFDAYDRYVIALGTCENLWRNNEFEVDSEAAPDVGPQSGCIR